MPWQTQLLTQRIFPGMRRGYFIEAGAAEGSLTSTTYDLEKRYGWHGICVEPNELFFRELKKNRDCHVFNCALHSEDGELEFLSAGYYGAAREHVDELHKERSLNPYDQPNYARDIDGEKRVVKVKARSLRSIFAELGHKSQVDFFSLDVEGGEEFVLKGFPFDTHKIMVCIVETLFPSGGKKISHRHRPLVRAILQANDMVFMGEREFDDIFVHADILRAKFW
jgi:FkbM family methyltransferase